MEANGSTYLGGTAALPPRATGLSAETMFVPPEVFLGPFKSPISDGTRVPASVSFNVVGDSVHAQTYTVTAAFDVPNRYGYRGSTWRREHRLDEPEGVERAHQPAREHLAHERSLVHLHGRGVRYQFSPRAAFDAALRLNVAFGGAGALFTFGPDIAFQYGF